VTYRSPTSIPASMVFFTGEVVNADFPAANLGPAGSSPDAPTSSVLAAGPTTKLAPK
jgi:hypothetical protein